MSFGLVRFRINYFMNNNDVDKPMGNAELRLSLASIENEVSDVKRIAMDTHVQALKTNGKVRWHTKMLWLAMGPLPILTAWAWYLTLHTIDANTQVAALQAELQQQESDNKIQVQEAVVSALHQLNVSKQ